MKANHSARAKQFIADADRVNWHDSALWHVRSKRDTSIHALPDWEQLREIGSRIKDHTLSMLDHYLIEFEKKATANGIHVHWAENAEQHNTIVEGILANQAINTVVKSKSMLTEECKLNDHLEKAGIEVVDTDLGERIIQLRDETPSHIVLPAIHLKKEEVGELFHEKLGTAEGLSDPKQLTEAARQHLRNKFLNAGAAITGVNFAVAETGSIVVCTNEGNADMGVNIPPIQIHSMGIEKVIPRKRDLGVFTRLLARSATGQPITIYTSHYQKAKPDGEMHVIILDNGRSDHLGRQDFRNALKCIRCGACINTCPIYRRSGGHSYGATIPGPIGSILTPGVDLKAHSDLPFASTLCGSCSDVCPVKIDIHAQLYKWRQLITSEGLQPMSKDFMMKAATAVLSNAQRYKHAGKLMRFALSSLPEKLVYNNLNTWGKQRDLPTLPERNFKDWYKKQRNAQVEG